LTPKFDEIKVFNSYSVLLLNSGQGVLEIDFNKYSFAAGKAVFLAPGQYLQNLSGNLDFSIYQFQGDPLQQNQNARYLFKHLVSLGYVELSDQMSQASNGLSTLQWGGEGVELLQSAVADWLKLNPFKASSEEIELLFDLKDYIDQHYQEQPGLNEVAKGLSQHDAVLRRLTKKKLASSVSKMLHKKLIDEAQRQVVFTDRTTKELAYELGFSYPTYFNRFFKHNTNKTPGEFRDCFGVDTTDQFREELDYWLDRHFQHQKFLSFYADQLHLSTKVLSSKIKSSYGVSFNSLLNQRLIAKGKRLLKAGENTTETAYTLGFKEPNHFSTFFKKHTGSSPRAFQTPG